jgi:CubicO group peptidase (beta-lactamase class C family)
MKRAKVVLLLCAALFVSGALIFRPLLATATGRGESDSNRQQIPHDFAERIRRVENGLLAATAIKGQQPAKMTIADRMEHYKVPGVSIAVINNGSIEWARGYGVLEQGGSARVTPDTRFQAASISKAVAATAALHYVEAQRLDLDEDVNKKLRSWKVPENEFTREKKVTLRRLVTHSAGLTVQGFGGYPAGVAVPSLLEILDGKKPANSVPIRVDILSGTKWRYSGGGFCVLQQLLIDLVGKPFPEIMQETVLNKAGMRNSTYRQPLPEDLAPLAAAGHSTKGEEIRGKWHTYPEMAAAGLWTTPSDLARFAIELQKARAGRSSSLISKEMATQMLTVQIGDWGLGLAVEGTGKETRFSHDGANEGFRCVMLAYEQTGQGVAIMTNSETGGRLYSEIMRSIAAEYGWPNFHPIERSLGTVDAKTLAAYAGLYELVQDHISFVLTVAYEGEKLFVDIPRQGRFELLPESETSFFILDGDWKMNFNKNELGGVSELVIHSGPEETLRARKVK